MFFGRPTGSAMPLVWAHAEYIKLLRSSRDRRVFDLIEPLHKRYVVEPHTNDLQVWLLNHKLHAARSDATLRIETNAPARLHWTANLWMTVQDTELFNDGLGIYSHEFVAGELKPGEVLQFTFYWTADERWEGRDFSIAIG
jgi:glucoamylase